LTITGPLVGKIQMTLALLGDHIVSSLRSYVLWLLSSRIFNKKPDFINLIYYQYDNNLSNTSVLFLLTINKEVLTMILIVNDNHFHLEFEYNLIRLFFWW